MEKVEKRFLDSSNEFIKISVFKEVGGVEIKIYDYETDGDPVLASIYLNAETAISFYHQLREEIKYACDAQFHDRINSLLDRKL